ncbi:MAG TPA: N,N-dimethylformamidase beta subunit family domain-containing protein [Thermoanaerobaculia bacterium]|nr:N,N-dimethylformamidase beta subunit family domain-containing protein [Thermoanaerobaculia bacterium]
MSHRRNVFICSLAVAAMLAAMPLEAARRRSVVSPAPPFNAAFTEGGYASATSVRQGEPITFRISTSVSPFQATIVNLADESVIVRVLENLQSTVQNCSGRFTSGCGWAATTTLNIPRTWPSGYYAVRFPTTFGVRKIIFVVKEDEPGSQSPLLIISPTHTYQAYNAFGGASLYPSNDPNRGKRLSFDRPYDHDSGLGRFDIWERKFVDWMREEGRTYEVATDTDMEDPTLLGRYEAVAIVGHSEYWTAQARENLETFSRDGGHIAIFGGNTMWWQVRLEENERLLVGYKNAKWDPLYGRENGVVTHHFWGNPVHDPENSILGTSFRFGGYANRVVSTDPNNYDMVPLEQRIGYTVTDPNAWPFFGANVTRGTAFGKEVTGLEVDGALYNCEPVSGDLKVDGSDGTPLNYHILAVTPASDGHGTLGYYINSAGGAVFNAATQHWVYGLASDAIVRTVTRNVLDRFSSGAPFVYDKVETPILTQELFNCPQDTKQILPGWFGNESRGTLTARCAYEGPAGLELSGEEEIEIARAFSFNGAGRGEAEVRFYTNADGLVKRNRFPAPFLTLLHNNGDQRTQVAYVEYDVAENGTRMIRIARRNAAGVFSASNFINLGSGWHLVEMSWRSPGTITLQVDGGTTVTLENGDAGQVVSELVIDYPNPEFGTGGFACIDALAVGTEKLGPVPGLK